MSEPVSEGATSKEIEDNTSKDKKDILWDEIPSNGNLYLQEVEKMPNLHILQDNRVQKAFTDGANIGLFHLF